MTTLTTLAVPARPDDDPILPPLPWQRMAWVTWRQHRVALVSVTALVGVLALYLWLTGLQLHHAYAAATACHPASSIACGNAISDFNAAYWTRAEASAALLQAVPALIGAFAGAPVLAREFETGTFRYAWTQGFGRVRWAVAKLVSLAVAVAVAAGALSLLFSWYFGPFLAEGQQTSLAPTVFDLRGVALAAWTLAAFAIGALSGVLIRRVVPALAAALAVYVGLALGASLYLREHYLAPLVTSNLQDLPGSAWVLNHWYTTKNGRSVSQSTINQVLQQYHPKTIKIGPHTFQTTLDPVGFLAHHGYTDWTSYQPGSRFWAYQWIEGGWLLALSVLLIASTVWLVHRRAT